MSTPINIKQLEEELINYPDKIKRYEFIKSIKEGCDMGVRTNDKDSFECKNSRSAYEHSEFVTNALEEEIRNDHIAGPYERPPFPMYRVSPISVVEGKYSKKKRLILDLSAPHDLKDITSINEMINKDDFTLQYVTIDHAIELIQKTGKGSLLSKVDIKDAFRILPIHPSQWRYFCVKWNNEYYFYLRLPFGARSSPRIFTNLSEMIHWIATNNYGIKQLLFLLDDFLAIDNPNDDASKTLQSLLTVFAKLGIPLNLKKTAGPATCLEYLGVTLDTVKLTASLPQEKVTRILDLVRTCRQKTACSKREILSVLGHLNFACRVVRHGRTFIASLIKLSCQRKELYHYISLTQEVREDLLMWEIFLQDWNGVSMFHDINTTSTMELQIFTDSSSSFGFGGVNKDNREYFYSEWRGHSIPVGEHAMSYRELYPIVIATMLWSERMRNKRIVFMCDNEGTVAIINKGRSKCPDINVLMRKLTVLADKFNFLFTGQWLSTKVNLEADALSRGHISMFQELMPDAVERQCPTLTDVEHAYVNHITSQMG